MFSSSDIVSTLREVSVHPDLSFFWLEKEILIVSGWEWDYGDALLFQEQAVKFVKQHTNLIILICCSHPRCYTTGRGLQKVNGKVLDGLTEFNSDAIGDLAYPHYKIKRGGGLTFHHPGQWILYPIVNLNQKNMSLKILTYSILDSVKYVIENYYGVNDLSYKHSFLGLWWNQFKLASIGLGIKSFVTLHGIALNLKRDKQIFDSMQLLNPCGISAKAYISLEDICIRQITPVEFNQFFVKAICEKKVNFPR